MCCLLTGPIVNESNKEVNLEKVICSSPQPSKKSVDSGHLIRAPNKDTKFGSTLHLLIRE